MIRYVFTCIEVNVAMLQISGNSEAPYPISTDGTSELSRQHFRKSILFVGH